MSPEPANVEPALEEQLVAYLDGELDAEASRRIEDLLGSDPEVRRKLQALDRTWELLGELDGTPVAEKFTQSTLEMVTVAAAEDVRQGRSGASRRRLRQSVLAGGGLLAAGLAGFLTVAMLRPDPDRQLILDLPILENLDHYGQIDDVEFLRGLRREGLFAGEVAGAEAGIAGMEESDRARRRRIQEMTPVKRARLSQSQKQFAGMDTASQIRQLHDQLQRDPQGDELLRTMLRYHEWLMTLPLDRRADLLGLDGDERIERIGVLRQQQLQEKARQLGPEDVKTLCRWLQEFAGRHEKRFFQALPEPSRQRWDELADPVRRWGVALAICLQMSRSGKTERPVAEDLDELRPRLSPAVRGRLASKPAAEQWKTVFGWIRQEIRAGKFMPPEVAEDLDQFCLRELSSEQQDRLIGLPETEMRQLLWRLYCAARFGPQLFPLRGSGHPPRHRHPDNPGAHQDGAAGLTPGRPPAARK